MRTSIPRTELRLTLIAPSFPFVETVQLPTGSVHLSEYVCELPSLVVILFVVASPQGGQGEGETSINLSVSLRFEDCPPEVSPTVEVVRACLRSDVNTAHDLRLAVEMVTVRRRIPSGKRRDTTLYMFLLVVPRAFLYTHSFAYSPVVVVAPCEHNR